MAGINLPDLYGQWSQARQRGEQRATDDLVRQNIGGALQGDSGAISAILKASPDTGLQLRSHLAQQQQMTQQAKRAKAEDFGRVAAAYASTKNPQLYGQFRALGLEAGLLPQDTPEALGAPEDLEESVKAAMAFAQAYGGAKAEPFTLGPGSKRFDASGRVVAEVPFAPPKADYQLYDGADGPVWLPKPTMGGGGAGQVMDRAYQGAVDPVRDFQILSQTPGVQVSSLYRDPAHNEKVGGVANSYHTKGQAGDFVVPPAQRAAFIAQARSMGYDAIDEGDHVHVEPRRGAQASSQYGAGQGVGAIPIPGARPKPKTAKSEIERRIELARDAGASEEEIKRMIIGREGAAAGAKPVPVGALKELLSIEDSLGSTKLVVETLSKHAQRIESGKLSVTPVNAAGARVRETLGMATTNDANLREFKSDITRTVNEWLRMNKGVQTEGDAQREYKAIMDSNDPVVVARSIERLATIMKNTVEIQVRKREAIQRNYGQGGRPAQAPAGGGWSIEVAP